MQSHNESRSIFYASDQDLDVDGFCAEDLGNAEGFKKSASASNLLDIDNSLENTQVLSKSLDFLDTLPIEDVKSTDYGECLDNEGEEHVKMKKSLSLPVPKFSPKNAKKYFKSISVGAQFGSKRFNLGKTVGSVIQRRYKVLGMFHCSIYGIKPYLSLSDKLSWVCLNHVKVIRIKYCLY